MIKQTKNQMLVLAAIASIGFSAPAVQAQVKDVVVDGKGEIPYVIDSRNVVARSGDGLCWRTGYWSPSAASTAKAGEFPAGCVCDSDIVAKEKCVAPVAAAPVPRPMAEKIKLAADTLFDFDKAVLKPEGRAKLDDLVGKIQGINLEVIIAVGHTDSVGTDAYNQKLSVRRAEAVKAYLVSKGIEKNRVYTEGKGEKQPVADNKTAEGRAKNRRVEIEVVGTRANR